MKHIVPSGQGVSGARSREINLPVEDIDVKPGLSSLHVRVSSPLLYMDMGQNYTTKGSQVLVLGSMNQGSTLGLPYF